MNLKHNNAVRAFTVLSRSWYADANLCNAQYREDITFGLYHSDGGTSGEMSARWYDLGSTNPLAMRLEIFDDSFTALASFNDVIQALAELDDQNITPEMFCDILKKCGFADHTKTHQ